MTEPVKNHDHLIEIWFPIEKDDDGYPHSKDWEQLLARATDTIDVCRLESVPFYLKNVSRGDLVKTKLIKNGDVATFQFDSVVEHGGHNTYRLLLRQVRPDDPHFTVNELIEKGLTVEESNNRFLAIDVPPSADQHAIDEYLVSQSETGRWEIQDGYLHTIETHSS